MLCSPYILATITSLQWDHFFKPFPMIFLGGSLILAVLIGLIWIKREKKDLIIGPKELGATDKSLKLFYGWVPVILGIHIALALLINGFQGQLFSSNPVNGPLSNWIGLVEIFIALSLFYGGLTRLAAILMGILWISSIGVLGLKATLESIQYLGFAVFFYLAGRGPYAIDRMLFPKLEPIPSYISYALLILRVGLGLNLMVFGFEKLAHISFASLEQYSWLLNRTNIPYEMFVLFVGALEFLAGMLIIFGVFPRTVILITLICINTSLTILDWKGLIDYLPSYAALAILLVWEPNNSNQKLMWIEGLRKNMS